MRNFYLIDLCCFCHSAYLIHQILGFPVPIFLTCSYSALLNFFYFLAHKISKSSTWTQYPIRNILRPAAKKKKTLAAATHLLSRPVLPRNLLSSFRRCLYIRDRCFLPQLYLIFTTLSRRCIAIEFFSSRKAPACNSWALLCLSLSRIRCF